MSLKVKNTLEPTQNKLTNNYFFADHPEFTPNISPLDVLKQGAFGGTYFRPIDSKVTRKKYKNRHLRYWSAQELKKHNLDSQTNLCRPFEFYNKSINKYKIRCGQTLEQWEEKNWISKHDPYGWFEWYCNFFRGRRLKEEDTRQIKRWKSICGPKGRFSQRLKNMVKAKKTTPEDPLVSPRIRQTLLHWGYALTHHNFTT